MRTRAEQRPRREVVQPQAGGDHAQRRGQADALGGDAEGVAHRGSDREGEEGAAGGEVAGGGERGCDEHEGQHQAVPHQRHGAREVDVEGQQPAWRGQDAGAGVRTRAQHDAQRGL